MLTKFAARLIENAEFQWSHFFSEMEIDLLLWTEGRCSDVSMEPLLFRNGNVWR